MSVLVLNVLLCTAGLEDNVDTITQLSRKVSPFPILSGVWQTFLSISGHQSTKVLWKFGPEFSPPQLMRLFQGYNNLIIWEGKIIWSGYILVYGSPFLFFLTPHLPGHHYFLQIQPWENIHFLFYFEKRLNGRYTDRTKVLKSGIELINRNN